MKRFSFCPEERIHRDREIQKILNSGHRVVSGFLVLFWLERNKEEAEQILQKKRGQASTCRFAMRLEKGFPNAVARNRTKRIFREIFRKEKWQIRPYTDLVVIIKHLQELKEFPPLPPCRTGVALPHKERWGQYEKGRQEFISVCQQAGIWEKSG